MENETQTTHKRRVRYKGKYPKKFEEKYKELQPEKYQDTIQHVMQKGNTPAGMHISIMVDEILEFLDIQPGQVGLDCTLGYGGHTSKMLEKLDGQGHVYGLDIDSIEIEKTTQRLRNKGFDENLFTSILTNFRNIDEVSEKYGQFDFVLADLGVSSMQIDNPERGFSYKKDGPLDLRLNPKAGRPASQILKELSREDLENILLENSDEPYADILAKNIYSFIRSGMEVETTRQLYKIIDKTLNFIEDKNRKDIVNKTAARVFQALRIEVNQEFEVLNEFVEKLPKILKPGGKVAILTFHSGEDRIVKKTFKEMKNSGVYEAIVKGQPMPEPGLPESFRVLKKELQALALDIRLLDENDQEIDERNIEDEERRFPRSIEKEDVNEEKEVVTDAMKSEELVETEESESL